MTKTVLLPYYARLESKQTLIYHKVHLHCGVLQAAVTHSTSTSGYLQVMAAFSRPCKDNQALTTQHQLDLNQR